MCSEKCRSDRAASSYFWGATFLVAHHSAVQIVALFSHCGPILLIRRYCRKDVPLVQSLVGPC